jgi:hypothetical protein
MLSAARLYTVTEGYTRTMTIGSERDPFIESTEGENVLSLKDILRVV